MTFPAERRTCRIRVACMALAIGLASTTVTRAQMPGTDDLGARLDPATAAAVRTLIESSALEGVPGEPLISKALEGQSKGASGERIVLAVRNLATDLASARRALGASAASSEIIAGAGALRSGASTEVLARLKVARGSRSVLLPLATLTDLVARGVPVQAAVKTVLALAERGAGEADYRAEGGAEAGLGGADAPGGAGAPEPAVVRPVPVITAPGTPPPGEPSPLRPR